MEPPNFMLSKYIHENKLAFSSCMYHLVDSCSKGNHLNKLYLLPNWSSLNLESFLLFV